MAKFSPLLSFQKKLILFFPLYNIASIRYHRTSKMPTFFNITLTFECAHCDYQNETKDEKRAKLLKRLHTKKCSGVGRTIPKRTIQDIIEARDKRNGLHVGGHRQTKEKKKPTTNTDPEFEDVPQSKKSKHHVDLGDWDVPASKKQKKDTDWRQVKDKRQTGSRGGKHHTQEVYVTDRVEEKGVKRLERQLTEAQVKSLAMKGRAKDNRSHYVSLLME